MITITCKECGKRHDITKIVLTDTKKPYKCACGHKLVNKALLTHPNPFGFWRRG